MDGWMDGWVDGWMDGWMDRQTDTYTHTHTHTFSLSLCLPPPQDHCDLMNISRLYVQFLQTQAVTLQPNCTERTSFFVSI